MSVEFDKNILEKLADKQFNNDEAVLLLNQEIDNELLKETPDFDYIDELTRTLLEITEPGFDEGSIPSPDEKEIYALAGVKRIRFSKTFIRTFLIAAIVFATTITANAAYTNATGNSIIDTIVNSVEEKKSEKKKKDVTTEQKKTTSQSTTKKYYSSNSKTTSSKKENNTTTKPETTTENEKEETESLHVGGSIGETIPHEDDDATTVPGAIIQDDEPDEQEATVPETSAPSIDGNIDMGE